jgi:hypothetical protein
MGGEDNKFLIISLLDIWMNKYYYNWGLGLISVANLLKSDPSMFYCIF